LRKNPGSSEEKKEELIELKEYRSIQATMAINRDAGLCVNCYWFQEKIQPYDHVHHTEGRGTKEKEQYTKLLCLCAYCHNLFSPIKFPNKEIHIDQKYLILLANRFPINQEFTPPKSIQNFDERD